MPKQYDQETDGAIVTTAGLSVAANAVKADHAKIIENQGVMDKKLDILVERVEPAEGGGLFYIEVTCSPDYNGYTFTATHKETSARYTAQASQNKARITVSKSGVYDITNDKDEEQVTVTVNDVTTTEVLSFTATINVTVPDELLGKNITCSLNQTTLKKLAETSKTTFTVGKAGAWMVGIEGNSYISKSVEITQRLDEKDVTLSFETGVPVIEVSASSNLEGKTLKCVKSGVLLTQAIKSGKAVFILSETGSYTISCEEYPSKNVTVEVTEAKKYTAKYSICTVFGVKVTKSEADPKARVVYTDDAAGMTPIGLNGSYGKAALGDWADTWIFEKIYPVMLKTNGQEAYRLDGSNLGQKQGGGASDVANINYDGNAMVRIGKFYSKYSSDASYEYYQISDEPQDGFEPIGFIREDGSEMDCVYMPCYMGSFDSQSRLRSVSGQAVKASTSYNDFLTAAKKNGTGYGMEAHPQVTIMDILYLILCKNDNCQAAVGYGRGVPNAKTGVTNTIGPIGCDTTTGAVTFMWMEDYWFANTGSGEQNPKNTNDYGYRWMEGYIFYNGKIYVKMKRPYTNGDTSTYTAVQGALTQAGYIKSSVASNKYGRIPEATNGSTTTYQCDYHNYTTGSTQYICFRGVGGLWRRNGDSAAFTLANFGGALSFEPPKGA